MTTRRKLLLGAAAAAFMTPAAAEAAGILLLGFIPQMTLVASPQLALTVNAAMTPFTVVAVGGLPPYTYSVQAGTLPVGVTLNASTGVVSGTPTVIGSSAGIVILGTDSTPVTPKTATLPPFTMVTASGNSFSISSAPTPTTTGTTGSAVTPFTVTASGGTAPYAYSVYSGYLPVGVTLNSSTGVVSGTPTQDGTYGPIVIRATDSLAGTANLASFVWPIQLAGATLLTAPTNPFAQKLIKPGGPTFSVHGQTFNARPSSNPNFLDVNGFSQGIETYSLSDAIPANPNPLSSDNVINFRFRGGRVVGWVSQYADLHTWGEGNQGCVPTQSPPLQCNYVNSAGIIASGFNVTSSIDDEVYRMRLDHCWDSIRFSSFPSANAALGLCNDKVDGCWISYSRDDAIENDKCHGLTVTDMLVDGCTDFISCDPGAGGGNSNHFGHDTVTVDGSLVRLQSYPYSTPPAGKEGVFPFKWVANVSPGIVISNTVIAFDYGDATKVGRWNAAWNVMTDGGGNILLWTADTAIPGPSVIGTIPAGWTVQTGATARATWAAKVAAWKAAHPWIYRMDTDTG